MEPSKRLDKILFYLKTSSRKLSQSIGLSSAQVFYNIKKDRNGFSPELARLICKNYPELNYEWLIIGKGDMLHSVTDGEYVSKETQAVLANEKRSIADCVVCRDKDNKIQGLESQLQEVRHRLADKDKQIEDLKNNLGMVISEKSEVVKMKDAMLAMKDQMLGMQAEKIAELESLKKIQKDHPPKQNHA